jgi:hypothetical protein
LGNLAGLDRPSIVNQATHMFYELSKEQRHLREQMKVFQKALAELEARAGIAEAAEKLRTEPPNYLGVYDAAERYSDEQRELESYVERSHEEDTNRRLRDLYFAVPDLDLRKELIAKHREEGNLALRFWQEEVSDATVRHRAAHSTSERWWVAASLWGIGLLGLGFYLFGIIGAMAGLLLGYFSGRSMEASARRARESAVAKAEQERKEAEHTWNEVRNEPQTFSQREATSGEPDEKKRRRQA